MLEAWQAIAVAACEQCGRTALPELAEPVKLTAGKKRHALVVLA